MQNSEIGIRPCLALLLLLLIALNLPSPSQVCARIVDRIAAVVDDRVITLSEVEEKASPIMERMEANGHHLSPLERQQVLTKVLGDLIDEQLVEIEAKKLHIDVTDQEVEQAYRQLREENGLSDEEFKRKLAENGLTLEQYKEQLKKQIRQSRLVHSQVNAKIAVTHEEVMEYAKSHGLLGQTKGSVFSLQHICIPYGSGISREEALRQAQEAYEKLKRGEPFEEVAANYSKVASAKEGGFLGSFTLREMAPFVKEVVTGLKVGEFSKVVDTPMGFQIFRLKGVSDAEAGGLPKGVEEEIKRRLYRQKVEEQFQQWLGRLRQKYTVKILL